MPVLPHAAISGNYTATWGGAALGLTEEGFAIEITHKGEPVMFEEFGQNMVDMIHLGYEVSVECVLKEWNSAALQDAIWPWQTSAGGDFGLEECVGSFAVQDSLGQGGAPYVGSFALPLLLTAVPCSPAGQSPTTTGPGLWTFHRAIMAPDVAARINLDNKPRLVPIRFNCFLCDPLSDDDLRYFTISAAP